MGLISIPGNIKQQYLPFVLDPNNKLNAKAGDSPSIDSSARAQFFSFKPRYIKKYGQNSGLLNICPSSLRNAQFGKLLEQDISFKTLFDEVEQRSISIDSMLNVLPGIQIREYLPDTRLDQAFNLFGDAISAVLKTITGSDGVDNVVDLAKWVVDGGLTGFLKDPNKIQKFKDTLSYIVDWITCRDTPNHNNLIKKGNESRFTTPGGNQYGTYKGDDNKWDVFRIFQLPYTIYYKLQSCVTTNIYELPAKIDTAFDVHGQEGWDGSALGIENTFLAKAPGVISKILNTMFGNVRINYMNWWDAKSGSATAEPEITIKFDLFNDTAESAMTNFIFINTLVPNNMWLQYGIFQHSSNIYDIKIDGHKRLFACAGNVKVTYKGVFRNPPPIWIRNLVNKHGNNSINKEVFFSNIFNNNLIKIPDIYEVELQFKSMLPQNFNTYLYQFSQNARIDIEYENKKVYEPAVLSSQSISKGLNDDVGDYVKNYDSYKNEGSSKK